MKKQHLPLLLCLLFIGKWSSAQNATVIRQYIAQFKDIAMEEMKRTGVPASITLAQGIHETGAGQSQLVKRSNNHFGIKCKSDWKGESVSHDDDARGECFRKYADPFESYKDHSDFLKNRAHYASLFKLDPTDYEGWAHGLKKAGYATNPKYPQILIKLIRDYNLQDYTLIAMGKKDAGDEAVWVSANTPAQTVKESGGPNAGTPRTYNYPQGVFKINETNVVFVPKGTPYLVLAQQYNIPLARLFEFNDRQPAEITEGDGLVFLQRKRKNGMSETHTVAAGETLYSIAQQEGIRLENLLALNHLKEDMQPAVDEVLHLQKTAPSLPKLFTAIRNAIAPAEPKEADPQTFYISHTVQPKETLYGISKKYNVTVEELQKWNDLSSASLQTNQTLRIKKTAANATN